MGSSRHKAARAGNNGECARVVNLRYRNGSLLPVGSPTIHCAITSPQHTLAFVHVCDDAQHLIATDGRSIFHEADIVNGSTTSIGKLLATTSDDIAQINALGNSLIVTTPSKLYYFLFHEGEYIALDNKPPLPLIRLHCKLVEGHIETTKEMTINGDMHKPSEQMIDDFSTRILGAYYKTRDTIHQNNNFAQPFLVRYALRMYDGSHILPSAPILLGNNNFEFFYENGAVPCVYNEESDTTSIGAAKAELNAFKIDYTIDHLNLEHWRDIITHIDFFVSKEINILEDRKIDDYTYVKQTDNSHAFYFKPPTITITEAQNIAREEALFYLLASIDLNNPSEPIMMHTPVTIEHDINPDNIIYQPTLSAHTSSFTQIGARQSYVYNSRLHLGNINYKYYEGYPPTLFAHIYNNESNNAMAYTRTAINLNNKGIKEVIAINAIPHFAYRLSPVISFPDSKATTMEVFIRHNDYEYHKTLPLTAVPNENRAVYVHDGLTDIDITTWEKVEITSDNIGDIPTSSQSYTLHDSNMMIVSELSNPFFFPEGLEYSISSGEILGLAATTTALSQGQYGEFPLYVFTSEGIWSMQHGTSEVCYARCTPLNNEHLNGNILITPTENAIIYRAGDNLSIISGSQVKVLLPLTEFAQPRFDELLHTLFPDTASTGTLDNATLRQFFNSITTIGYLQNDKELIFCNPSYPYSIVLHLPSGHLYRFEYNLRHIVNGYNTLLAQGVNNAIYNLNKETEALRYVALITHPMQFISDTYTRLRQVLWRMQGLDVHLTITIAAAHEPDGTYRIIHSFNYDGEVCGHIPSRTINPPYKWYRFSICGEVSPDFHLDCADVAFIPTENNRLR